MIYQEAKKYMETPLEQEIPIAQWGGNIVIKGLNFEKLRKFSHEEMIINSIVEPKGLTIDILKKKSGAIYNRIVEIILIKNGIHEKSLRYANTFFQDDGFLFHTFYLAKRLNKNVWSDSKFIIDYFGLEILFWKVYFEMTKGE